MNKNKERMNNIEKQVKYIVETYGHAPEEASKKICALFSVRLRWSVGTERGHYMNHKLDSLRDAKILMDGINEYYKKNNMSTRVELFDNEA